MLRSDLGFTSFPALGYHIKPPTTLKTHEEYEQEIADLTTLIEKMKFQLGRSLESMIELISEVNRLKSKYEP